MPRGTRPSNVRVYQFHHIRSAAVSSSGANLRQHRNTEIRKNYSAALTLGALAGVELPVEVSLADAGAGLVEVSLFSTAFKLEFDAAPGLLPL